MPGPTQSQRIEELKRELNEIQRAIVKIETSNDFNEEYYREELERLRASIDKLSDKIAALENRVTSLEERAKSLEKLNDRTWQIAPMVISVAGVLISLLVAYFKK